MTAEYLVEHLGFTKEDLKAVWFSKPEIQAAFKKK